MKTRRYRHGTTTFRAYMKRVGLGYEVGLLKGTTKLFVGNFIHSTEANRWWTFMNKQVRGFGKKYPFPKKTPSSWYNKFLSNHMYNHYYTFINKVVPMHGRSFKRAVSKDVKKWKTLKKRDRAFKGKSSHYLKAA